jgi:hypothetical protein
MAAFGAERERTMNQHDRRKRTWMQTDVCAVLLMAAALIAATAARASEAVAPSPAEPAAGASAGKTARPASWEYSSYRIVLYVEFDSSAEWPADRRSALQAEVESQVRLQIGGLWQLKALDAPAELHWNSAADIARVTAESLPSAALASDKAMLIGIRPLDGGRHECYAREYDTRTQTWGSVRSAIQRGGSAQSDEIVPVLWSLFRPLLRIEEFSESGVVTARARGGSLPTAMPKHPLIRESAVFRPLIRHFDANGQTIKHGIFPVDWTWLVAVKIDGAVIKCSLTSGVQGPLELKLDGRTEYLAIATSVAPGATTELVVQARGTERAIEDLEVLVRSGEEKSPRLVGRTDSHGAIKIPANGAVQIVDVSSGDDLLARFPFVPGFEPSFVVQADDNGRRLESGNLVSQLDEELIDLVAQQTVLKARFQRQVVHGNLDAAEKTLAAIKSLKTLETFVKSIEERRAALADVVASPTAAAWLDKHLDEIKPLATNYLLDAKAVSRFESILTAVRGR